MDFRKKSEFAPEKICARYFAPTKKVLPDQKYRRVGNAPNGNQINEPTKCDDEDDLERRPMAAVVGGVGGLEWPRRRRPCTAAAISPS